MIRFLCLIGLALLLGGCRDSGGDPISRADLLTATGPSFDHGPWNRLVEAHVDANGGVDYAGMAADRAALDGYLASLAGVEVKNLGRAEQLAFWINGYNGFTVASILEKHPDIRSVNDIPDVFKRKIHRIGGQTLSLNNIEGMARASADPRVHFAVNCASVSCPPLRAEAYTGAELNRQLDEATRLYMQGPEGAQVKSDGSLAVSSLFKWYSSDFQHPGESATQLDRALGFIGSLRLPVRFARPYLTDAARARFDGKAKLVVLDYNWSLNTPAAMATPRPVD